MATGQREYESFFQFQIPELLALSPISGFSTQQSAPKQVVMDDKQCPSDGYNYDLAINVCRWNWFDLRKHN